MLQVHRYPLGLAPQDIGPTAGRLQVTAVVLDPKPPTPVAPTTGVITTPPAPVAECPPGYSLEDPWCEFPYGKPTNVVVHDTKDISERLPGGQIITRTCKRQTWDCPWGDHHCGRNDARITAYRALHKIQLGAAGLQHAEFIQNACIEDAKRSTEPWEVWARGASLFFDGISLIANPVRLLKCVGKAALQVSGVDLGALAYADIENLPSALRDIGREKLDELKRKVEQEVSRRASFCALDPERCDEYMSAPVDLDSLVSGLPTSPAWREVKARLRDGPAWKQSLMNTCLPAFSVAQGASDLKKAAKDFPQCYSRAEPHMLAGQEALSQGLAEFGSSARNLGYYGINADSLLSQSGDLLSLQRAAGTLKTQIIASCQRARQAPIQVIPNLPAAPTAASPTLPAGSIAYYSRRNRKWHVAVPRGLGARETTHQEIAVQDTKPPEAEKVGAVEYWRKTGVNVLGPWPAIGGAIVAASTVGTVLYLRSRKG